MVMAVESSFGDGFLFLGFIGRFVTLDQWSIGVSVAIGVALVAASYVRHLARRAKPECEEPCRDVNRTDRVSHRLRLSGSTSSSPASFSGLRTA